MVSVGIVKRINNNGGLNIPEGIRKKLKIKKGDSIEIFVEGNKIILKKHQKLCVFCSSDKDLIRFRGKPICRDCIEETTTINNSEY
jgi:transcriptional pleiotropic regulator of transition state genes